MKKIRFVLATFIICLATMSCGENQHVELEQDNTGTLSENVYRNHRVGWTMRIPDGWKVMSQETTEELYATGKKAAEDTGGIEMGGAKTLLNLQRGIGNDSFLSLTQNWKGMGLLSVPDPLEFLNGQKLVLENIMRSQGVTVDFSVSREETIDTMTFTRFDVKASNGVSQTYYFALLEDYYFCAILTYTSNSSRDDLLKAWESSRFDR
jgi:hypothetical protein